MNSRYGRDITHEVIPEVQSVGSTGCMLPWSSQRGPMSNAQSIRVTPIQIVLEPRYWPGHERLRECGQPARPMGWQCRAQPTRAPSKAEAIVPVCERVVLGMHAIAHETLGLKGLRI